MRNFYDDLVARAGFAPDQPIDATQALPVVRPAAERASAPVYPDPGPDLTAVRHTRWPEDPPPAVVDAAAVWEQGAAILRRLSVIESQLAQLLAQRGAPR